jgi:hypothetical protein
MPNIGGSRKPSNRYRRDEIKAYRSDMFSKTKPYMAKMVVPTRYDATMKVCFHFVACDRVARHDFMQT